MLATFRKNEWIEIANNRDDLPITLFLDFFDDKYYYRNSFCYHKKIYILEYDILYNMVDHYYYGNWKV